MLLTTEAGIVDIKEPAHPVAAPNMGGMGGGPGSGGQGGPGGGGSGQGGPGGGRP